jgi:hypothetical protein
MIRKQCLETRKKANPKLLGIGLFEIRFETHAQMPAFDHRNGLYLKAIKNTAKICQLLLTV